NIKQLSGGMKRRLLLARALVNTPEILILDEPTTGLDPHSRHAVWDKLNYLKSKNTTLILTTHYMEEAERLCDRVAIMDRGKILALDTVEALLREHGGPPRPIRHVSVERATLEDVFLHLTGRLLRD
ncbi:MAG: ABC transporter ATP-binding protein, partial [Candidatus Eisenbacteria bacterium]